MVHDLIVIGGGPAGLTAGVYARTRNLSTLILEAEQAGGQLSWLYPTKSVYDYPSYIAIEGHELGQLFVEHARVSGVEVREGETVEEVRRGPKAFEVRTSKGVYEGRAVIVAIGNGPFNPRVLEIPGETEHEGRGVHYRVRDRRSFKGHCVLVVGGGDSALEIALEVVAPAKEVTLVHRRAEFRAMEKNVQAVQKSPVNVLFNSELVSIEDVDGRLDAVVYNNMTLEKVVKRVDSIIINVGFEPLQTKVERWGLELEGARNIKVRPDMSTSVPGVFACGDAVWYPSKEKRIVTGCGEAVTAVISVYKYLKAPYWA
ncbi:MAG: NAD(P)/FAD-dependent oxidoreductase [Methanobacteriota archaeon]|nr:MAG: NAD(P)/FAD-dependent oxidoreductase [Euryarchaeota archaeon]